MTIENSLALEKLFAPLNEGKLTITPLETKYDVTPVSNSISIALGDERKAKLFKQIWFWCSYDTNGVVMDGKRWVWKSANDFRKEVMPTWKLSTVNKLLKDLAELGVVHREKKWKEHYGNTNDPRNRTYYYAINLPKIKELFVDAVKRFSPDFFEPTSEVDSQLKNASKPYAPSFAYSANLDLRVSANHSKDNNQIEHLEEDNIETHFLEERNSNFQLEKDLKSTLVNTREISTNNFEVDDYQKETISFSLVRKNLREGINDRDQRDLSQLQIKNKERGGGATLKESKETDQNQNCVLSKTLEKAKVSPEIEQPILRGSRKSDRHRQPHRNGSNTNGNLQDREIHQNYNNPGGIAPGDDPNDPELVGRRYNAIKAVYSSKASDPWMETRIKLHKGFLGWLKKRKQAEGQEVSLVNLKAEIRNNYERAQDYWDDYEDQLSNRTKKAAFGSIRHILTHESLDAAENRGREIPPGEVKDQEIDYKAKLEKEAESLRQLEEATLKAEKSRHDYQYRQELKILANKEEERALLLRKIDGIPTLKMRFPDMTNRLDQNAAECQTKIQKLTTYINQLKREIG